MANALVLLVLITGTKVFTCRFSFFVAVSVCSCRFSCRQPTDKAFVICWQPTHVDILLLVDKKYMISVVEFSWSTVIISVACMSTGPSAESIECKTVR